LQESKGHELKKEHITAAKCKVSRGLIVQ